MMEAHSPQIRGSVLEGVTMMHNLCLVSTLVKKSQKSNVRKQLVERQNDENDGEE